MTKRCAWASDPEMQVYHDKEWGRPVHDDQKLFEFLILEGAQAGLSWSTILKKRPHYRKVFAGFDPRKVARFTPAREKKLLQDPGIVRNRLKVRSAVLNAQAFLRVAQEFGSFDRYVWGFVDHKTVQTGLRAGQSPPPRTAISDALSKDLKKRGFKFVGSTICYAFMQACGLVNDHAADCESQKKSPR